MKSFTLIAICLVFLLTLGCGSSDKKKPSGEALKGQEIISLLEQIRKAYINKNNVEMQRLCTKEGFRLIQGIMKPFDSAELSFTPTLVEMRSGKIYAHVSWQGRWSKNNVSFDERGMAIFVIIDNPLRVDNVLRTLPFKYPE